MTLARVRLTFGWLIRRLWDRLLWRFVGLAGAMRFAIIVGRFKEHLERNVALRYLSARSSTWADAVGT